MHFSEFKIALQFTLHYIRSNHRHRVGKYTNADNDEYDYKPATGGWQIMDETKTDCTEYNNSFINGFGKGVMLDHHKPNDAK